VCYAHPVKPDPKSVEIAREKWRGLFSQVSYADRWHPIALELDWIITGKPDEADHKKLLPDYCYSILELFRRTIFNGLSKPSEVIRPANGKTAVEVDWKRLGMALGIGMRGMQFFDQQLEGELKELELEKLSPGEAEEVGMMLGVDKFIADLAKKLGLEPNSPAWEQYIESALNKLGEKLESVERLHEKAFESGPAALEAFTVGSGKGIGAFLTPECDLRGEGKLKMAETYWMLLLTWPEIGEMLRAQPPKRMEDLWDWLTPFSYAGWIEIQDLDQLVSLCREIKLKLKKPGAPRGPRKKC
jgi:hypothetical protein